MPGLDGLGFLKRALEINPDARIIMLTAYGTIETAVEAMKRGAFDFLVKPLEEGRLQQVLTMAREAMRLSRLAGFSAPEGPENEAFLAVSSTMRKVKDLIRRVASLTTTVLIQGETGTGKELVARAIHSNSPRKDKPFIAVNCANLSGNLLESELFGHEKGAFTGADARKLGKFELASGGTLFLDEVAEIPLELQAKLLRAIQEQEIERVGGTKPVRVDVRLVSATNRPLAAMVETGGFRNDLFYRLNVFPLKLPPLRDRKEEIPVLSVHILQELAQQHGRESPGISPNALEWLKTCPWPGNIRELRNLLERAFIVDEDGILDISDFGGAVEEAKPVETETTPFSHALEEQERSVLIRALQKCDGNVVVASKELGLPRRTFYDKMKKLGLDPAKYRPS
jgi:DNA-binding NtrC family response regulator